MIIQCEKCATRFKVADDKVTADGIKVRCSKCQHVFTARANDPSAMPSAAVSRPSGIFAAPETQSAPSSSAMQQPPPPPLSSGKVEVPQASLAAQDPTFDPFAPPAPGGSLSFELEDAPPPGEDRSFFGPANHTIGGFDDDDVPAPPPEPTLDDGPPPLRAPPPRPPPRAAAGADPFANPLNVGQAGDPFASQPPSPSSNGGGFGDPFGAANGHSSQAAFPTGGDPFAVGASADPFSQTAPFAAPGGGPAPALSATPPGADPFSTGGPPPFSTPPSSSSPKGDDPFSGLGVEVDPYAPAADEPPPPPPAPAPPPVAAVAPVVAKAAASTPNVPVKPRRSLRIPPAVPRAAWAALQACILVAFLTMSIVWVRGGSLEDITEGRALDVVTGRAAARGDVSAPVRVEEVVVTRRPLGVAADLVVVSGFVVNAGEADAPAARVTVRFGDKTSESAWANTGIDGIDLDTAASADEVLALNARVPSEPGVGSGERVPFVVLARGVADGAKANVVVEVSEPPQKEPPEVVPVDEEPTAVKGKKLRRRPSKGETGEGAAVRPRVKRAGASG